MPTIAYTPRGLSYAHISTATSTLVKTGPGMLATVVCNAAGTGATVTVYDGVDNTGTVVAAASALPAGAVLVYNCVVRTGIYVVTVGSPAADFTVTYSAQV